MYNNRNLLYDKTIYDISLPGTHDSSTYNINGSQYINLPKQYSQLIKLANILHIPINNIIKGWVKTQNLNIYEYNTDHNERNKYGERVSLNSYKIMKISFNMLCVNNTIHQSPDSFAILKTSALNS